MNGFVDEFGRALVTLRIRKSADTDTATTEISVWVDTAFNGELDNAPLDD